MNNIEKHFYIKNDLYNLLISLKQNPRQIFREMEKYGFREGEMVFDLNVFFDIWDQYSSKLLI